MLGKAQQARTSQTILQNAAHHTATRHPPSIVQAIASTPLGRLAEAARTSPVLQARATAMPNRTGLPDGLKANVEAMSGFSMDDVRVHRNSPKPAQLHAHAYAQGTDIHLAPGQEKYLPHEAWHVVQQKQGRVRPTMQLKGVGVNDDAGLEREADAISAQIKGPVQARGSYTPKNPMSSMSAIQRQPSQSPPTSDGLQLDTKQIGTHNNAIVPTKLIAMTRNPAFGGVPSVEPPGWGWLRQKHGKLKGSWVRFHIINANLGGPGNQQWNLVPTPVSINHHNGWRILEEAAKKSALSQHTWTYVEAALTYDNDFPAGIPKTIKAEWGRWDGSSWGKEGQDVSLQQQNPDDKTGFNYLPSTQITQNMLLFWGAPNSLIKDIKSIIDDSYKDQDEFDERWDEVLYTDTCPNSHIESLGKLMKRFYVAEEDGVSGPFIVMTKTK